MAEIEIILPKMGESIIEATLTKWLKNEGDAINIDEPLIEVATDKVDSEVPSNQNGTLVKKLFNEGDVVPIGIPFAIISTGASTASPTPIIETKEVEKVVVEIEKTVNHTVVQTQHQTISNSDSHRFYSPLVMNIARTENVSMTELENIKGSGKDGRVTKADIIQFVSSGRNILEVKTTNTEVNPLPIEKNIVIEPKKAAPFVTMPGDEIIEMDRMR